MTTSNPSEGERDDASSAANPEKEAGISEADQTSEDDPHKVEKLTKAGRDLDPDEGTE